MQVAVDKNSTIVRNISDAPKSVNELTPVQATAPGRQRATVSLPAPPDLRLRLMRAGMRTLSVLAPSLAVRAVDRLWFTPIHAPLRPEAKAFLESGERLHFQVRGRDVAGWTWGEGPIVLLLHGWGGHSGQMQSLAAAVVAAGYRAVAIDGPGHGASQTSRPGDRRSSFVEVAEALREAAAALVPRFGPIAGLIAHSGGCAAVALAIRDGWRPPSRMVFLAPFVHPEASMTPFGRMLGASPRVMADFARYVERRFDRAWPEFDVAALPTVRPVPPLLIVHDRDDAEVSYAGSQDLAAAWPQARLVTTTEFGHRRLLREEAVVAQAVAFVAQAAPALMKTAELHRSTPADARDELDRDFDTAGIC